MISVSIQQVITTLSKTNIDPAIIKSLKTFLVLPADQKSQLEELNDPNNGNRLEIEAKFELSSNNSELILSATNLQENPTVPEFTLLKYALFYIVWSTYSEQFEDDNDPISEYNFRNNLYLNLNNTLPKIMKKRHANHWKIDIIEHQ